jgi:hypothetical protein
MTKKDKSNFSQLKISEQNLHQVSIDFVLIRHLIYLIVSILLLMTKRCYVIQSPSDTLSLHSIHDCYVFLPIGLSISFDTFHKLHHFEKMP